MDYPRPFAHTAAVGTPSKEGENPHPGRDICTLARTIFPEFVATRPKSLRAPQLELTHEDDGQSFRTGGTFSRSDLHQSFLHWT